MGTTRSFGSIRKLPSGRYQARYRRLGRRVTADTTFTTKAAASGLRFGELSGLTVGNFDVERCSITVSQALMRDRTALTEAKRPGSTHRRIEARDTEHPPVRAEVDELESDRPPNCLDSDDGYQRVQDPLCRKVVHAP